MINEAKTRKLFSLILQYYILYKDASYTREIYYKAYEIECERELKIKNRHIPSMTMSKKAFKRTITTTSAFSLAEYMLSGNPPVFTLFVASTIYGFYVKNNIDQHQIDLEHLQELKQKDNENIKKLKEIVTEISKLSKELHYNVTLHTGWIPTEEELYHMKRYYEAELQRLYPRIQKTMKY